MSTISPGQVVRVKPQSNIYTLLLVLAILFLGATVGIMLYDLMTTYGMTFASIFTGKGPGVPPT